MDQLAQYLSQIQVPQAQDNIYNEECVYSYDTPETETGLYVSLSTFLGFGKDYVEGYFKKTGNAVFLHIQRQKTEILEKKEDGVEDGPDKKITRLAIGIEGGAETNKKRYQYNDTCTVVIFPSQTTIPYPSEGLPALVVNSIEAIISAESALKKLEKEQLAGTWDGEMREVSTYALELNQFNEGKKIPPFGWKCEKCDLTNNLWLNLTDGSILCGRKFFDGTGGNDHAVEHFKETNHPLAVKLGTITSDGKGDVFSYAEEDMVEDPYLQKHLAHFGINTGQLEKTEKSMIELELELNQKVGEWATLQESSASLKPIAGPEFTGMSNLGNSCYLNSVMQVVFSMPDFIRRFVNQSDEIFSTYPADPVNDFNVQMAKLGVGLCSGKYSSISEDSLDTGTSGINPTMFKNMIGKGHSEFSTKQQQDAQEYFMHLINVIDRQYRNQENPTDALKFRVEDRVECLASGKVKYSYRDEWCLPLLIPLAAATNLEEVRNFEFEVAKAEKEGRKLPGDHIVRPKISLQACLDKFGENELVDQFYSTAINDKTTASKRARLATMPDYLMLHLKKFTLKEDWTSIKLDVSVDCPDILDIGGLRGHGLVQGEEELPELVGALPAPPAMDPAVLQSLAEMGFPMGACKRAIYNTSNSGLEPATQWLMEHITDADFDSEFVVPGTENIRQNFVPDPSGIDMLMGMGFNKSQATKALKETGNNIERAVDYIFSHPDDLDELPMAVEAGPAAANKNYRDGDSRYRLVALISHMGSSSQVGHYVCHIQKNNQWIIFNDNKVAISQNPPKDLGYLYLYERIKN